MIFNDANAMDFSVAPTDFHKEKIASRVLGSVELGYLLNTWKARSTKGYSWEGFGRHSIKESNPSYSSWRDAIDIDSKNLDSIV